MLDHSLTDDGILVISPEGALTREDFAALAATVDPFIENRGRLDGILIDIVKFPGWKNLPSFLSHVRFVRDHHRKVRRVAVVTDDERIAAVRPLADHFVNAEVRRFPHNDPDAALAWLRER